MLNNKSQIKRRARRFFTQRACFSAVADCTSTISGASLFQSRVTTLPATLKTCSDLEDAAGMAKMTLKIGARMDNGLQKIIEKSVYCKVKIPNQNKTLTSALTYCLPRPAPASLKDPSTALDQMVYFEKNIVKKLDLLYRNHCSFLNCLSRVLCSPAPPLSPWPCPSPSPPCSPTPPLSPCPCSCPSPSPEYGTWRPTLFHTSSSRSL